MKKIVKSGAFISFMIGFALYILVMLPELIYNNGILIIDGDSKSQLLPFSYKIRDSIINGNTVWDGSTGLGGQFLSLYAYYNLFSPFSILYLLVPRDFIIYAIPYVSALKYGVGSMLAYFYIKRFTDNRNFAVIGGFLYMFSSFSAYNLCFHFDDIFALFPLFLIALEELCTKRRYGIFALVTGFMAMLNYYFFFGQVVFIIIYFFIRGIFDKSFGLSFGLTIRVLAEGIIGVMLSAAVLLPVGMVLSESAKATTLMSADSMLVFDSVFHYLKILQSAFMIPDGLCLTTLFPENDTIYPFGVLKASVAAYLPLFSLTGVISYIWAKRKSWMSVILALSAIFAFVPVLNQAFSAFNSGYYTRWFYMPMLIAALVSVKALENRISFKPGIITCGTALTAFILYAVFTDTEQFILRYGNHKDIYNPSLTVLNIVISVISLLLVIVIVKSKRDKDFIPKLYIFSVLGAYMCYGIMAFYIVGNFGEKQYFIDCCFADEGDSLELENCARLSSPAAANNLNQIWGYDSVNYFNSIHDPGFERYITENNLALSNGLYSPVGINNPELAGAVSVKYFLSSKPAEAVNKAFGYVGNSGTFNIYENPYYIPMGYTYDRMISHELFSKIETNDEKQRVYAGYMVSDKPSDFAGILALCDDEYKASESDEEYLSFVEERKRSAANSVTETADGYTVDIYSEKDTVMCLGVSYNKNWKAYIDGEEVGVYEVNNGLVGVILPAGNHKVELIYCIGGLSVGLIISGAGILILAAYIVISKMKSTKVTKM